MIHAAVVYKGVGVGSRARMLAVLLALAGCQPTLKSTDPEEAKRPALPTLTLEPIASRLENPVAVTHAGDGSGRLFITTQPGRILIFDRDRLLERPFLDIEDRVYLGSEQGLLSIAFHPNYARNGRFFVNYTDKRERTVIATYHASENPDQADRSSEEIILTVDQPAPIHNGGQIQFGPDGFLYIGMGDGGSFGTSDDADSGGDPRNLAQNPGELYGKLLRIDVDSGRPYAIPADNPFRDSPSTRPEVWALGLRNPWRFSFDRATGDLFVADVGEMRREEVNFRAASSRGGENYGWRRMEGSLCFNPSFRCNDGSLILPILEYDHYQGCAVIGGYRYRGARFPDFDGTYFYADFCNGKIYGATPGAGGNWTSRMLADTQHSITSFGENEAGELFITAFTEGGGTLFQIRLNQPAVAKSSDGV